MVIGSEPVLLTDDQVQRYIVDGFLVLDCDVARDIHDHITQELRHCLQQESPHPGDNVLPRIPALNNILECPVVVGAMTSLLGPDYAWAPHRFPHNSEPVSRTDRESAFDPFDNAPAMGPGSVSGAGWHQDGHSRAGRSRWHTFRAVNMFYFPHDTPLEMGPTRLLAGTHLYATLRGVKEDQVVWQARSAGTIVIADFDVGHAGSPNRSDLSRYMVKFVGLRTRNPTEPAWDHGNDVWRTPERCTATNDLPMAWQSLWNWMRAVPRSQDIVVPNDHLVPALLTDMDSDVPEEHLNAMYTLAALGARVIPALVDQLLTTTGQDRHLSPANHDPAYVGMSEDHNDRHFSTRQLVPEDAAVVLGVIGGDAVPALLPLLDHEDPWIRINAVYALGEIGTPAMM
ncbi:MAG: HEAT repeat domain-containing protein, partial [Pseudomonadota bacterium]